MDESLLVILYQDACQSFEVHHYEAAIDGCAEALSLIDSDAPQILKAPFLSLGGLAKKRLGYYEEALRDIEDSIALKELSNVISELLPDLTNAANVLVELKRYDEALHYYERCAALRSETDLAGKGRDLANIGATHKEKGNYELSIDYIKRAYAIQRKVGDWYGAAMDLNNLGQVYFRLGDLSEAKRFAQEARDLRRQKSVGAIGETENLNLIGHIHFDLDELDEALGCYKSCVEVARRIHDRLGEAIALQNAGLVYFSMQEIKSGIEMTKQALSVYQMIAFGPGITSCLGNLANYYYKTGDLDRSAQYAESSLESAKVGSDYVGEGHGLLSLGNIQFERGDYQDAADHYRAAAVIFEKYGRVRMLFSCLTNLANATLSSGKAEEAQEIYARARNLVSNFERISGDGSINVLNHDTGLTTKVYGRALHSKDGALWIPALQLLASTRFIRGQEAVSTYSVSSATPPIKLIVSHRWLHSSSPDPKQAQAHIVLRSIVEGICLSKGIVEGGFMHSRPEIVLNRRLEKQITAVGSQVSSWADSGGAAWMATSATDLLSGWINRDFPFLTLSDQDLRTISTVLSHIGIWYDFTCMPQRPFFHSVEREFFRQALETLPALITNANVLIAWDVDALDRGWCLLEGMIAEGVGNASYNSPPEAPGGIATGANASQRIRESLAEFRSCVVGKSADEVSREFTRREVKFSLQRDHEIVSKLMADYLSSA